MGFPDEHDSGVSICEAGTSDAHKRRRIAMISLRILLTFVLGSVPTWAQSQDVSELLAKSAGAYAQVHDYVIEVKMTKAGRSLTAGAITGADFMPRGIVNQMLLARSGNSFRYEVKSELSGGMVWIDNGETTWQYFRDANKYTEQPSEKWPERADPGPGLAGFEWEFVLKFRELGGVASRATLVTDNIPSGAECPSASALVEIRVAVGAEPVTERLRIAKDTGLICGSVVSRLRHSRGTRSEYLTTNSWTYRQLSGPIDANLFRFAPPKNARKVQDLR